MRRPRRGGAGKGDTQGTRRADKLKEEERFVQQSSKGRKTRTEP